MLGFNDMSTPVGYFVWSPRGREKREEIVEEMKEKVRGERKMNESEGTKEIKTFPSTLTYCKDSRPCPAVSQYQLDALVTQDTRQLLLYIVIYVFSFSFITKFQLL